MQNEISKKELVKAYCKEKMSQDEYNKMVAFYFKTEETEWKEEEEKCGG